MNDQNILLEQKNSILLLTLNRSHKLNTLNKALRAELHTALVNALNDSSIRGIIITGAGQRAFAAGADITEFEGLTAAEAGKFAAEAQTEIFDLIENSPKPVIAAVNGYALGGGLELALACHIRLASENAVMGLPELSLGIIPGFGGTQRLTKLIGKGRAFEMILTSAPVNARYALEIGLVNKISPLEELLNDALELMKKILKNPPLALGSAIKSINAAFDSSGFEVEINAFASCFSTQEPVEGIKAFIEKRQPKFGEM